MPPSGRRRRWPWVMGVGLVLAGGVAFTFFTSPRSDTDFVGVADTLCDELRIDRLSAVAGVTLVPQMDQSDSSTCSTYGERAEGQARIRFHMATGNNVDTSAPYAWNADASGIDGIGWKSAGQWPDFSRARIVSLLGNKLASVTVDSENNNYGDAALAVALLNEWLV